LAKFNLHASLANILYRSLDNFKFDFDTKLLSKDIEIYMNNLHRVSALMLDQYGERVRQQMVAQFVATQKYRKPRRKTGRTRDAIDQHVVAQSRAQGSEFVELKIGNRAAAPIYLEVQEKGHSSSFQFWQKFQKVRGYSSAPRYPFRASYRLLSHTKEWFASHPKVQPYLIRVKNPGIQARGFIKRGNDYIVKTLPALMTKIFQEAGKK
jgi:hypothetical protein